MTNAELQEILQGDNNLTVNEVLNILYQIEIDINREITKCDFEEKTKHAWYNGEINAFYIARNLISKIGDKHD